MTQQLELFSPAMFTPQTVAQANTATTKSEIKLRDYQEEALAAIDSNLREQGYNRQLLHLATGLGKTFTASECMRRMNRPVLAMMHREELAYQAMAAIRLVWPDASIGLVKAENNQVGRDVTVALVQTLSSEKRFKEAFPDHKLAAPHFIWTDEVHHGAADTYRWVYDQFGLLQKGGSHFHLGVTATPKRADDKGLVDLFDTIAYSMGIRDGIGKNYLCDLKGHTLIFSNSDMDEVTNVQGDYNQGQLDKAVRKVARNAAIIECWQDKARLEDGTMRQTIAFCVSVEHAHELAGAFTKVGVKADVVYGEMDSDARKRALAKFQSGKTEVMCNVGVLTEGFDYPPTGCILMARPTKSGVLYTQMAGRGTRLYPGKKNCLILDVADVSRKNTLNQPVTLGKVLGVFESDGTPARDVESAKKFIQSRMKGMGPGIAIDAQNVAGGKEFDPFADPFSASELVGFRWHKGASGLTLSLPKEGMAGDPRWLVLHRHPKTWLYDVALVTRVNTGTNGAGFNQYEYRQEYVNKNQFPSEEIAAVWAGDYAKKVSPGIARLADKNANWRKDEFARASQGQMDTVKKLYRKGLPPGYNPNGLTKGQASELIDLALAQKIKLSIERPERELEFI